MKLPSDENNDVKYCKLQKSIYGLKQSGREWFRKFNDVMISFDFKNLTSDSCLFVSKTFHIFVLLYVDDILIMSNDLSEIINLKNELSQIFQMKDLGEVENFLGISIKRNFEKNELEITLRPYVEKLLKNFKMDSCNPCKLPIDVNHKSEIIKINPTSNPFRELIGSLQYLSLVARPDISIAVNFYSRFQENPDEQHFIGLKRVLRYLKGTIDYKLIFKQHNVLTLQGFADADFANDQVDRKSISGYVFKLFGNTVSWSTKKQSTISLSTTEAELISLCTAAKEGVWIMNLLKELNFEINKFTLFEDNIPCIRIAEEPRQHQRIKHVDIKYMFIRDLIMKNQLELKHLSSSDQVADVMTKQLAYPSFIRHLSSMGLRGSVEHTQSNINPK